MKKYYIVALSLAVLGILPILAKAEDIKPRNIINELRTNGQQKIENMKENQDYRNIRLGEHGFASSSKAIASTTRAEVRDIRQEYKPDIRNATNTADRKESRMDMRGDIFHTRMNGVIRELNLAINNLKQIRTRIDSRITKEEQSGTNMQDAKNLLAIADTKISLAEKAILDLNNVNINASSTSSTEASSTVNLDKPRKVVNTAVKAVNDAKGALSNVVRAIILKIKDNMTVTSTTTVNASSTVTASTTTN